MSKKFGFPNSVRFFVLGANPERTKLWYALTAAIALQLFILYYQLNYGALVGLIEWDDCAILLRGLENIDKVVAPASAGRSTASQYPCSGIGHSDHGRSAADGWRYMRPLRAQRQLSVHCDIWDLDHDGDKKFRILCNQRTFSAGAADHINCSLPTAIGLAGGYSHGGRDVRAI